MNVITWLGIYYVKQEMYEAAIPFFSRASQIEPAEVKWSLMVASCFRRMGAYPTALKLYEDIHKNHPNDIECVRYLITICKEMKQNYEHYAVHLRKLERMQEAATNQAPRPMGTVSAIAGGPGEAPEPQQLGVMRPTSGLGRAPDTGAQYRLPSAAEDEDMPDTYSNRPAAELYEVADPTTTKGGPKRRIAAKTQDDEDEWGNDELNDDLLPM